MEDRELYGWAIKGLVAEWQKLEKDVLKGRRCIEMIERKARNRENYKSVNEIKEIIANHKKEIDRLYEKKTELEWILATLED